MITIVNAVIIRNAECIILTRQIDCWTLPGGKLEQDETAKNCLRREISEELPQLNCFHILRRLGTFSGQAPHKKYEFEAIVFLAKADFNTNDICPGAEIKEAVWARRPEEFRLSETTTKIVRLIREQCILI